MQKLPLEKPQPDIEIFLKVIKGEITPERPPLVELFLDYEIIRDIGCDYLGQEWVVPNDQESWLKYTKNSIDVYHKLGYDYMRATGGLDFPGLKCRLADDTANDNERGRRTWTEEGSGPINSWEDFDNYQWPDPEKSDLSIYEFMANNLLEGMGLFVCPTSGFLEVPLDSLIGYEKLCYLLYDDPELVKAIFQKTGEVIHGLYKRLIGLPNLVGFFQGDDMGYKTGTMVGAGHIRDLVLPWHKKTAELAHENGLVYLLHSCGNLEQIMGDLIDDVKIDGRHSFEDEGNSVFDFEKKYGERTAVLGGIDLHKMIVLPDKELRAYVRKVIEACLPGGRFAVGSGNTVCNYVPVKNYLAMVDEAVNFGKK